MIIILTSKLRTYALIAQALRKQPPLASRVSVPPTTKKCLGVDLGRTDIAHTSSGDKWNGKQITDKRNHYAKTRAILQKKATKGTRSSRRRCRQLQQRLSGKEKRFQSWLNHNISRRLVDQAATSRQAIAMEDLTGIREGTNQLPRSKKERRLSNNWAFYQLRQYITYKCLIKGVDLVFVPPAYTSQTCSKCLHIHPEKGKSYRKGKKFVCGHCGVKLDADRNGANNIAALGICVIDPRGSGLYCNLETEPTHPHPLLGGEKRGGWRDSFEALGLPKAPVECVADGSRLLLSSAVVVSALGA